jgi:hypothetical protein
MNILRSGLPKAQHVGLFTGISTTRSTVPSGRNRVTRQPPQCVHQKCPSASTVEPSAIPYSGG